MKYIGLGFMAAALMACQPAETNAPTDMVADAVAAKSYGAYMIVTGRDYDPKALGPYAAALPPIYAKYGGEYVVFSTDYDVTEGAFDEQAVIISGWADAAAARAFWDSPEYTEAIKLREGIGEFTVVIVPALPSR